MPRKASRAMHDKTSFDLLIECPSCGVENLIADYVPSMHIFCSQCREQLIDADIIKTHCEYICQACDMRLVLLKETEVKSDGSACSCGSTDLRKVDKITLAEEVAKAGGLIDLDQADDNVMEDVDWLRPADPGETTDEDYEDMFNQDPGHN